jgi:flagellum-specific ATP synthase
MMQLDLTSLKEGIDRLPLYRQGGRLRSVKGLVTCTMAAAVGDQCMIHKPDGGRVHAEVIGFTNHTAYLMPYDSSEALEPGMMVVRQGAGLSIPIGPGMLGRVIDALGRPVDGRGPLTSSGSWPVNRPAPPALDRARIREPFITGQRTIDALLTCGRGQRIGIFSGSGVGKSTLLGEIAKGSVADINVIALVGERGREVAPFLEDCLGKEGMARSVVVVATCDQSPLMRVRAVHTAGALADYFREQGAHVLLMIDSLTRLAMAQREIGLLLGEPPSSRGYTPSVFQLLATTVERLGNAANGGITAMLTVLVDGDDLDEPISDAVRSLVDGHIVLDRKLAERGHYPAINISRSISRVAHDVTDKEQVSAARKLRAILAAHVEVQDLIRIGAYARGTSPQVDRAIDIMPSLEGFLRQDLGERNSFAQTRQRLLEIAAQWPW